MERKIFYLMGLLLILIMWSSCTNNDEPIIDNNSYSKIELTPSERLNAQCHADFAWKAFEQMNKANSGKDNMIFSPLSANITLSMLANGANEEAQKEILTCLGLQTNDISATNSYLYKVISSLEIADKLTTVRFANSLWSEIPLYQEYIDVIKQAYNIDVFNLDHTTFVNDVNKWAKDNSNGMIPMIYAEDPMLNLAIINTTYLKGKWSSANKFSKSNTKKQTFNNNDGSKSNVEFMNGTQTLLTGWSDKASMCVLSFGNGAFRMGFILPDEGLSIEEVLADISGNGWNQLLSNKDFRLMRISIPKFEVSNKVDLARTLQAMGMTSAIGQEVYQNLSPEPFAVKSIAQHVKIKINEEGAEAVAATVADGATSAEPIEKREMIFDRPFIYFIMESSSQALLFIGKIDKF